MKLLGNIATEYFKLRINKIEKYLIDPIGVQENLFSNLIRTAEKTAFGQQYDFKSIQSIQEFQDRLPVVTYEAFQPYLQRVIDGEQNVVWPTEIKWFAKSSGTTNDKSKFIPVSKEALEECLYRGPRDLMCVYAHNNPDTKLFTGKSLVLVGSQKTHESNSSIHYGDVSAVMAINQPFVASIFKAPNLSVALMEDWEAKIERIAEETIPKNITNIGGVPTWMIVLIKRILEKTGKDTLKEVWPNLELYIHGGVSFEPYRATFKELIGDPNLNYYQTYNASEGFFAYQYENDADDMVLALNNGIFYEFIPAGQFEEEHPKTCLLSEVEVGKNYAMVITTNSGLWRYKIGDTVKFTSVFPFKIKVSGRTKHFINAFGEEVIIDNANYAVQKACQATGAYVKEYTVAPVYFEGNGKASHEWLIEFEIRPASCDEFMTQIDEALKEVNSDYEAKRKKDMALTKPKLTIAKEGVFYKWLKQKGKLGGQHKVPRLSNDRNHMEELLQINFSAKG
ncbi:MAG: GH3 auxin-responsive promoter family protein [Bacteroidetes bacterium]|nr:GH3 auxin-responsive promoter family protein [Bacteroidota bacterium]